MPPLSLYPKRRQEAKPQRYCVKFWSLPGRTSHLASVFRVINAVQNKVRHVCLFKRSQGEIGKEGGTLTEMRGVGDGTLQAQRSEAVFIKKPSETPYYENLVEKRCASTSLDLVLAFFWRQKSRLCRDTESSPPRKLPKSGVFNL